ncbi:hypothetical protein D3C73_983720 [compost metagenome]
MLQQADGHFELFCQQGLLESRLPVALGGEPLAGAAMPGTRLRPVFFTHQLCKRREDLQPVCFIAPRLDEAPQSLQGLQVVCAVACAEQVLAQAGIEPRQMRQHSPGLAQGRAEHAEQFVFKVVMQGVCSPMQLLITRPVTLLQQGDPYACAPTATEFDNPAGTLGRMLRLQVVQQPGDLGLGEGQAFAFAGVEFIG